MNGSSLLGEEAFSIGIVVGVSGKSDASIYRIAQRWIWVPADAGKHFVIKPFHNLYCGAETVQSV